MKYNLIIVLIILGFILINQLNKKSLKNKYNKVTKNGTVNQDSYQKYAKFYETVVPQDQHFNDKMNKIYEQIEINKKKDIKKIAASAGCTYEECILKIRYLKNKRQINEYHIDHINGKLIPCTEAENKLLKKYKPYIYNNHLTIAEIATRLPEATTKNLSALKEQVYSEIKDLYESNLLNGIKINEVDKELVYYTIEKRKKEKDYISISCDNCGALNDVNRGSKVRCAYCNTIIEDKTVE